MTILGIHIDGPYLRAALIKKGRKKIEICSLIELKPNLEEQPPADHDVKRLYIPPVGSPKTHRHWGGVLPLYIPPVGSGFWGFISRFYHREVEAPQKYAGFWDFLPPSMTPPPSTWIENFTRQTVSGLSAKDLLIRSLELKIGKNKHLEEAIAFQAEAMSSLKPEEVLTLSLIQKQEKERTEALLFTAPREALQNHLSELERLQIEPDVVSATPLALFHFTRWKFPQLPNALMIYIGSFETSCILIEGGLLKKSHAIPLGVEPFLSALFEDRKKVLLKSEIEGAAKQMDLLLLKSGLNPSLTQALEELRQEIGKVRYAFSKTTIPLIFTGRTDAFTHLTEFLANSAETLSPLSLEEQKHAVSLGLGLGQWESPSLQFRREEFFFRKNWKNLGLYALSLCAASLLLSTLFIVSTLRSNGARKAEMLHLSKASGSGSIEEKIDRWITSIETHTKEYPYLIQSPKVSEVLAWLSSHPLLHELKMEGDPIDLIDLHYSLQKFPQMESPKDPYLAKVELEFRFKSPTNARKFHEALRQGDNLVNSRLNIDWDVLNNSYRTSFFLKNRSPYAS